MNAKSESSFAPLLHAQGKVAVLDKNTVAMVLLA
jgi:hypothetical protein